MKKMLILLLAAIVSFLSFAGDVPVSGGNASDIWSLRDSQNVTAHQGQCGEAKRAGVPADQLVGRGCCSWHNGQCGCSFGRVVCCDGSYSPSCTCAKEDPPVITN